MRAHTVTAGLFAIILFAATASADTLGDLSVSVPAGWQSSVSGDLLVVERIVDVGWGQQEVYRLVFHPPEAARDSAAATFDALYSPLASAAFASPARPLPIRVRLSSGATLLYDGGTTQWLENGAEVSGMVYVVVQGNRAVAALGVLGGWEQSLATSLRQIFDGVSIAGASAEVQPLFTQQEIAGRWGSSSTSLANWVDASGNYIGDASLATGETLSLYANGMYRDQFAAVGGGGGVFSSDTSGAWAVEDDTLVMTPQSGADATRYRITGVGSSADGRGRFLFLGVTRDDYPFLYAGSSNPNAGNLYVDVGGGCDDSDGDHICDSDDQCPDTPADEPADASGCSCSQLDDDGDGVMNCDDADSGTPSGEPDTTPSDTTGSPSDTTGGPSDTTDNLPPGTTDTPSGETTDTPGTTPDSTDGSSVVPSGALCPTVSALMIGLTLVGLARTRRSC
jgi:hypothetical protein